MSSSVTALVAGLCAAILFLAAAWHAYWAFGGRRGYAVAIPQHADGRRVFEPSRRGTLVVAMLIAGIGGVSLVAGGLLPVPLPAGWSRAAALALSAVFLARALGPFRFAGWFKQVRGTPFATFDTRFYCPLCLALGLGLGYVGLTT